MGKNGKFLELGRLLQKRTIEETPFDISASLEKSSHGSRNFSFCMPLIKSFTSKYMTSLASVAGAVIQATALGGQILSLACG